MEDDRVTHVVLPIEEYERLTADKSTPSAVGTFDDVEGPWITLEDFKLQLAADRIVEARKATGLTQEQLAAKLKMPQSQISRIERNPDHTTVRTLKRIAAALKVDVRKLL